MTCRAKGKTTCAAGVDLVEERQDFVSKSCQDFSSDLFLLSLKNVFVVVDLHFILHFSVLFLGGSLKCCLKVQCHITPAPITDVMWLHPVCSFVSAVVTAPSSGGIGFLLPSLASEQPRASAAKVHPADSMENLELTVIFCRYWAKHYSA